MEVTSVETQALNIVDRFVDFLKVYEEKPGDYKYRREIARMAIERRISVTIDFMELLSFDEELASLLVEKPREVLEAASEAIREVLRVEDPEYASRVKRLYARIRGLPETLHVPLRGIRAVHLNKLVALEGIVTRISPVKQRLVVAAYRCKECGEIVRVPQDGRKLERPLQCPRCTVEGRKKGDFELLLEESEFIDWQKFVLQEKPEELPPGQLPRSIEVVLTEDLVDTVRPGDRAVVTGILEVAEDRIARREGPPLFRAVMRANHVEVSTKESLEVEITPEDEKKILELSRRPDIHDLLAESIAPSIYGYKEIKRAIAALLFGGVPKVYPDGVRVRGDIHVLLIGDPGTAKSQLLRYVASIAPRGIYTTGKGSTAAGLTAAVVREKTTGDFYLEAGALVLADGGVACIDEFDKMDPRDRVSIHEAMEQQSYHPSVEILLSDGTKVRIGDFVDKLMKERESEVINGVRCQILPLRDPVEVIALDPRTFELRKVRIDRVSRHVAPDRFVEITFSNGRRIIVTPEHPVFVFRSGRIVTVPALDVRKGDWVPGIRELPCERKGRLRRIPRTHPLEKEIPMPEELSPRLARILGYIVSEGYSHLGSSAEIGFVNSSRELLEDFESLMKEVFGLTPILRGGSAGRSPVLRYVSAGLYRWLNTNFPGLLRRAREKRVPAAILGAPKDIVREFLRAAFLGDGGVESESVAFSTSSRGLAEDYQDLLLRLGIHSRLSSYVDHNGKVRYKVYVTGDSLGRFCEEVLDGLDPRNNRVSELAERSRRAPRHHDVLPTHVAGTIVRLLKALGLPYDGYFNNHLSKGYGICVEIVERYLRAIEERIREIEEKLGRLRSPSLKEIRAAIGWSQSRLAKALGVKRSTIDYAERGGYDQAERKRLEERALDSIRGTLAYAKAEVEGLRKLMKLRFLRVRDVKVVPNEGELRTEWVYDVTVEPFHNFVSHGLVLHNTISIAKAGIVATLNARASVLAAANPAFGRYIPNRPVTENIDLPVTILSRFDLIFIITDRPNKEEDRKLAEYVLDFHRSKYPETIENIIPPSLLKKYIAYARKYIKPKLSDEAKRKLVDFYVSMRAKSESPDSPIAITPRQLEALIRLAEAHARMGLREVVTGEDAEAAIELMTFFLKSVGVDVETQRIDIDVVMTGQSKSQREKVIIILDLIKRMVEERGGEPVKKSDVVQAALEKGIDEEFTRRVIERLLDNGELMEPRPGYIKRA